MSEARDLVFFYNGVEATDETIVNVPVDLPLPEKGGQMRRGGKVWKVVEVLKQAHLPRSHAIRFIESFLAMSSMLARPRFRSDISFPEVRRRSV